MKKVEEVVSDRLTGKVHAGVEYGANVVLIPGVTSNSNPFPKWLQDLFTHRASHDAIELPLSAMQYDTVNKTYQAVAENDDVAGIWTRWGMRLHEYLKSHDPALAERFHIVALENYIDEPRDSDITM